MPANESHPRQTSLSARAAAHQSWANTDNRSARTAPARAAFLDRFEREVDPERRLSPAERIRRAESARRAYFLKLAAKSAKARNRRASRPGGQATAEAAS